MIPLSEYGGPNSGNHGHSGRPGKVGGSGGGVDLKPEYQQEYVAAKQKYKNFFAQYPIEQLSPEYQGFDDEEEITKAIGDILKKDCPKCFDSIAVVAR